MKIAVIGAGLSGLTVACRLKNCASVTVFEKSKGYGGRMATRRTSQGQFAVISPGTQSMETSGGSALKSKEEAVSEVMYDHGAQFFTARSKEFKEFVAPYLQGGQVAPWPARFIEVGCSSGQITREEQWPSRGDVAEKAGSLKDTAEPMEHVKYVGVPGMSAFGKAIAEMNEIDVRLNSQVKRLSRDESSQSGGQSWSVFDEADNLLGRYDWIITTQPAEQAHSLLSSAEFYGQQVSYLPKIASINILPCYALLMTLKPKTNGILIPHEVDFDIAVFKEEEVAGRKERNCVDLISRNTSKPGRASHLSSVNNSVDEAELGRLEMLTVLMKNQEALAYVEGETENAEVGEIMLADLKKLNLSKVFGGSWEEVEGTYDVLDCQVHRWKYAKARRTNWSEGYLVDRSLQIASCGDWCITGKVEAAFSSASQLASFLQQEALQSSSAISAESSL